MDQNFSYHEPLVQYQKHVVDPALWDRAMAKFKAKDYKGAMAATVQYINRKYANEGFAAGQNMYVFRHGSVKIYLKCEGNRYSIRVPFVRLPEPAPVALLRQINEINFAELTLSSMQLIDGVVELRYEDALELSEPFKVYDLLREMSQVPDFYDDVFIDKFKATPLEHVDKIPLSPDQLTKAYHLLQTICAEAERYANFLESQRCDALLLDPFCISFYKIGYVLRPQGFLRSEVLRSLFELKTREAREVLVKKAKKNLEKIKMSTIEKLAESLYIPDLFMSDHRLVRSDQVLGIMEPYFKMVEGDRNSNQPVASCFSVLLGIYEFFTYYKGPDEVEAVFKRALMQASQKPWMEASNILYQNLKTALNVAENMQMAA